MCGQAPCVSLSPGWPASLSLLNLQFLSVYQAKPEPIRDGRSGVLAGCASLGCSALAAACPPSRGGDSDIPCDLQDCRSPESHGSPEPKRPGGFEAASGSQEKLDFHRNLKEGQGSVLVRMGAGGRGEGAAPHAVGIF